MSLTLDREGNSFTPDPYEHREIIREPQPLSFDDYRIFCDQEADCFRKLGVLEADNYHDALGDPRAVFCEVADAKVPILLPIDYEPRYDADRIRLLTGKQNIMLLAVPVDSLAQGVLDINELLGGEGLDDNTAIIIEEPRTPDGDQQVDLAAIAHAFRQFGDLQPHDFIDKRLQDSEKNKKAWMGIFDFSVESNHQIDPEILAMTPEDAFEAGWKAHCQEHGMSPIPEADANGAYMFTAEQLKAHPEIVDSLWAISKVGFGEVLGQYHPISMEVTREFFEQHITSDGVFTTVSYRNGEPLCFGFLAPSLKHNDWLNTDSSLMQEVAQQAAQQDQDIIHFFELISKGQKELAASTSIISLFLDIAGRARPDWRVLFESTNLSETYIPRIITLMIQRSNVQNMTQPVRQLAELGYSYLAT